MAFYQCSQCKKVWQYPITKCPDCFLNLEKMPERAVKVIGVSRVGIPTLLHPKTPYFVLLLEDKQGNKWAQKSIKEYKIGDNFRVEISQNKKAVAIFRIKYDILEAIEKITDLVGGIKINQNSRILILPTLISPKHPYFCDNTSPQFLESVVRYLIEKGADPAHIKVLTQSFNETPIEVSFQKSQLFNVCLKNKIASLDLAKGDFIKRGDFELSKEAFSADFILNLPILKVGRAAAATNLFQFLKKESYQAMKSSFSSSPSLPTESRLAMKRLFSEKELAEKLLTTLPNCLTIAEALSVQKTTGLVGFLGLVLAGFDVLNLDRVFAEISMSKPLPKALEKVKIDDIPIIGRNIMEVQYEIEKF